MSDLPPMTSVTCRGVEYLTGSAGSFVMACPSGCHDAFRGMITREDCLWCGAEREPVRMDELATRWQPLWRAKDGVPV